MIRFKEFEIEHHIKPIKNIYLKIYPDKKIVLSSRRLSKERLYDFLKEREGWLRKNFNTIEVEDNSNKLFGEDFDICEFREYFDFDTFYKDKAKEYITKRTKELSKITGLGYNGIKFRKMKRRWGSCDSRHNLTFNTYLITKDKKFIDEVILHELCHTVYFDHSKKFYNLLDNFLKNI